MAHALALAARGKGSTAPNPCVGAVLVRQGDVVAEGWHGRYGGPHAEVHCLEDARAKGVDPAACTLYVTLEPCNHQGKTPACTKAVLEAGIARVMVGCADPNPRVQGGGAEFLRGRGVEVVVGVLEQACRDMIADFFVWQFNPRTYNILKMAATLDGRIAARTGHAAWVSSEASRAAVHGLRERVDAVMVGGATFRQDNPALTARPAGRAARRQPLAVVVTSRLPGVADDARLLRERPEQTIFWTGEEQADGVWADSLRAMGVAVWGLPERAGGLDLAVGCERLRAQRNVFSLLCEGGGALAYRLLEQGLMDELLYFLAPRVLGDAMGVAAFSGACLDSMEQAVRLRLAGLAQSGQDVLLTYRPVR